MDGGPWIFRYLNVLIFGSDEKRVTCQHNLADVAL
jgi:hypothetical protein